MVLRYRFKRLAVIEASSDIEHLRGGVEPLPESGKRVVLVPDVVHFCDECGGQLTDAVARDASSLVEKAEEDSWGQQFVVGPFDSGGFNAA